MEWINTSRVVSIRKIGDYLVELGYLSQRMRNISTANRIMNLTFRNTESCGFQKSNTKCLPFYNIGFNRRRPSSLPASEFLDPRQVYS